MISIVIAYFNRKKLFQSTLESLKQSKCKEDFEVIVVDDGSDESERLEELIASYPFLKIIRLKQKNKWYNNSCIPYNEGFKVAKGDKIIIQNPECYHFDDILSFVSNNLDSTQYLSFGCFALDKHITDSCKTTYNREEVYLQINDESKHSTKNGMACWYNHSIKRSEAYHFCTAITADNLKKLGGFDEMYSLGIGFDDNEFVRRVKKLLPIKFVDKAIVLHQNHYNPESKSFQNRKFGKFLYDINYIIYKHDYSVNFNKNQKTRTLNLNQKKYFLYPRIIFKLITIKEFYQLLYKKLRKKQKKQNAI